MKPAELIAKLDEQRTRWVDLPDGKRLRVMRPLETDADRLTGHRSLGSLAEALCTFVVGWSGFTEADLLGAALGASDEVAFDAALCLRVLRDRGDYVVTLGDEIRAMVKAHRDAKDAAAKN